MSRRRPTVSLDERRVRRLLALFFLALAVPALILVWQAYSQLNWQAFRQTQLLAEELAARVDTDLAALVRVEEARSFGDYEFLIVEGDPAAGFVQRSALSAFPVESAIPGVLGYFQVNADGALSTPLLPRADIDVQSYGISAAERAQRLALENQVRAVLERNGLVHDRESDARVPGAAVPDPDTPEQEALSARLTADESRRAAPAPAQAPALRVPQLDTAGADADDQRFRGQAAFDRLTVAAAGERERAEAQRPVRPPGGELLVRTVDSLGLEPPFADRPQPASAAVSTTALPGAVRQSRTEQISVPEPERDGEPETAPGFPAGPDSGFRVSTFESEIDPFELRVLDSGHLLMFRKVWREDQRYIQGAVIEQRPFLAGAIERAFRTSSLSQISDLIIAYGRDVLSALGEENGLVRVSDSTDLAGSLLYQARLSPPLGDFELIFSLHELPRGPAGLLLGWVTVALAAVLLGGFVLMYRFALGQIRLARQQQDFVSAVSHELKTPLTSIRMYGEMLKAGWTDQARRQTYYDYIFAESERLSRLIENVLQLARMTRKEPQLDVRPVAVAGLMDMIRSKVDSQVERAGFELVLRSDAACGETQVPVDADAFAQIVINLVDNALKFAAGAPKKVVEIASRRERDGTIVFTVRDFGPGVPRAQMKKIFELFYRPDDALTRDTAGTGIGLALVHQLATAMGARVDVRNREPGAEFSVRFERRGSTRAQRG